MRIFNYRFTFSLIFCCFALANATIAAQDFRGQISGRVTEASGAAVPNATVTVTNAATNSAVNATTNESGEYTVLYLTPNSASFGQITSQANLARNVQIGLKFIF